MNDSTNASSLPQLALVAGSGLVAAVGLVGNAALLAALCTQQSARLRNKLLLHVCAADLLVCAVSVPLATSARWGWAMGRMACYFVAFLQTDASGDQVVNGGGRRELKTDHEGWALIVEDPERSTGLHTSQLKFGGAAEVAAETVTGGSTGLGRQTGREMGEVDMIGEEWLVVVKTGDAVMGVEAEVVKVGVVLVNVMEVGGGGDLVGREERGGTAVPVSASTLSLTMLALDRYAVVTHPRLRHRRYVAGTMMATVWILTLLCCATQPLLHCRESWVSPLLRLVLTFIHLVLVHVVPCVAVTMCHIVVAMKLVETSLTAAAARGEVPLPMPLLCRPRHVIIVASVANEGPSKVVPYRHRANLDEDPSSDDDDLALRIQADLADLRARLPRSKAKHRLQKKHLRFSGKPLRADKRLRKPPPPLLVKPAVGQSLKSRRRLARMLVVQLTLFAVLWLPLVACELCVQLAPSPDAAKARNLLPLCLLLGHTHSAVSPLLYWLLNRQALQGCVAARALHSKFRLFRLPNANAAANANYNPSSTNEAALGAFHPRYITPRPPPRCATSQFLQ
ncbi:uncharacterized protein [Anabrus simplex]|uniref:uncharacterized protein n=1 Tax=Anabrus simplex TaxID=316456 RepID=UPI0035A3066B